MKLPPRHYACTSLCLPNAAHCSTTSQMWRDTWCFHLQSILVGGQSVSVFKHTCFIAGYFAKMCPVCKIDRQVNVMLQSEWCSLPQGRMGNSSGVLHSLAFHCGGLIREVWLSMENNEMEERMNLLWYLVWPVNFASDGVLSWAPRVLTVNKHGGGWGDTSHFRTV